MNIIKILLKKEIIGTLATIIILFLAFKIIKVITEKIMNRTSSEFDKKRKDTVIKLLKAVLKIIVIAIAVITILDLFGINVSSLVASLGIASAVGALSLQDTFKDIISGSSIIMDNYFMVGDVVRYNDFLGTVTELGLRTTKIKNADGEVLIIANRNITEVTNLSQKTSSALIKAPVAYEENIEKVEKVIGEIVEEIKTWDKINKEKTEYIGITELDASNVNYGIRIYCHVSKLWEYKRMTLRLIKQKFDENDIKIPYNQIEVHEC